MTSAMSNAKSYLVLPTLHGVQRILYGRGGRGGRTNHFNKLLRF